MASLKAYEFTLQRLLGELRQQKTELIAAPGRARPDEAEYRDLSRRLGRWLQRLQPIQQELRNREQFLALRGRKLHQVPRAARYGERQSIDGHRANLQAVWRLVAQALAELDALDRQRHGPASLHDMVRGVEEVMGAWAERAEQVRELQQIVQARDDGPAFRELVESKKQIAPGDLANLVVTGVMLLAWLVSRLERGAR